MTTLAEVRADVARIVDYQPEPSEIAIPDHSDCPECLRRQGQHWPPSEMCEALYSAVSRRNDENRRREAFQHYQMRDIARVLLAALPANGVIVTPDSLARALKTINHAETWDRSIHCACETDAAAAAAAIAAEGGPA